MTLAGFSSHSTSAISLGLWQEQMQPMTDLDAKVLPGWHWITTTGAMERATSSMGISCELYTFKILG